LDTSPNEPGPMDYPSPNKDSDNSSGTVFGHGHKLRESTLGRALPCRIFYVGKHGFERKSAMPTAHGCSLLLKTAIRDPVVFPVGHHGARVAAKNLGPPGNPRTH
jgi:hypothetical protein